MRSLGFLLSLAALAAGEAQAPQRARQSPGHVRGPPGAGLGAASAPAS